MSGSVPTPSPRFDIRHPLLAELFDYWNGLREDTALPLKSRFDPVQLPASLWPRLHMIDVPADGGVCRNRVLGTYVAEAVGFDFTGQPLTEEHIPGVSGSITYTLLQQLLTSAEPQHYYGPSRYAGTRRFATHEQLLLPLFGDDGRTVAAVGALDYTGFTAGMFMHREN